MALDGLVIHSIVNELHNKLLGGKIDKVYQPENDEVVLHIRNNKENFKLVLSCSASNPRVYLANNYKKENPIFKYINNGDCVYFVHSYYAEGCDDSLLATAEYGKELTAAVAKGNIYGCQFPPEKSGKVGLNILKAFCEME